MNLLGPGTGFVWARYAVMGVDKNIDFGALHGLRTEVTGLRSWLGLTSVSENQVWPTKETPHVATFTATSADDIDLGGEPTTRFVPVWLVTREEDSKTITDAVWCETRTKEP
jgi:hypothetical protein